MDAETKTEILRMFTYGMFILTSKADEEISASTITWVTQSSFKPPLVTVALKVNSGSYRVVKRAGQFALHVVPEDGKSLAKKFIKPAQIEENTINGIPYAVDREYDIPIIDNLPAYIVCSVREIVEIGDHHVVIAEVVDAVKRESKEPILLRDTGWTYGG